MFFFWRTTNPSSPSQPTSTPPLAPNAENPTSEDGVNAVLLPISLLATPSTVPTNDPTVPPPGVIPAIDPIDKLIEEAQDALKDAPDVGNMSRGVDAVGDAVAKMESLAKPFMPFTKATVAVVGQTDFVKAMKEGINEFSAGMPKFMAVLSPLASHPLIGVVVLAFKTGFELEQNRHTNDKKIISLYVGMKNMMEVLTGVTKLKNDELAAIEDQLKLLVKKTAEDIKKCSNACDTYMKKRPLAKVIMSNAWDKKLLYFVNLFSERRRDFQFHLIRYTSVIVDKTNVTVNEINDRTRELSEQMKAMTALFQQFVSPEQKRLSKQVAVMGVEALRNNIEELRKLDKSSGQSTVEGPRTRQAGLGDKDRDVDNFKENIFEDPNAAVEKNLEVFLRKFEDQRREIMAVKDAVHQEGDRIVQIVQGRAHERIRNQFIHDLWVEMNWRGNVKARHFVLALRDHFLEKPSSGHQPVLGMRTDATNSSSSADAWAMKFIDVMRVQPIMEAFDDDASGFITVTEVNEFTSSRPREWSLPHWLAFWAVGFKWSIIDYAWKIEELFAKMEGMRAKVLPPNREAVDKYFATVWVAVHTLTAAVSSQYSDLDDPGKFELYLDSEKTRLEDKLITYNYIIDGIDTVALITGKGRIEKTVFPLLYLLMKRHYEIMRIMCTKVVNFRDLYEGADGILYIQGAIQYRVKKLANNFSQQRLDPEKEFESFAYGIFKYFHNAEKSLWTVDYVRGLRQDVIPYNDDDDVQPGNILNYGYKDELSVDNGMYDGHSVDDISDYGDVEPALKDILGHWHGHLYDEEGARMEGESMMTFVLVPAEGDQEIKADAWSLKGRYIITGSWSKGENGVIEIKLKMSFPAGFWAPKFFNGHFDAERDVLTGVWDYHSSDLESSTTKMECRRIAPHYLTVYPDISELSDNKPRSLWRFAIAAVRNDVHRDRWSWTYFSQRREDRTSLIPLLVRSRYFGPRLTDEEIKKVCAIPPRLTSADACFYGSSANNIRAHTWVHEETSCDSCDGCIGGPRLFCLDCVIKVTGGYDTVDLCCEPACIGNRLIDRDNLERPHEPNHRLVKARTPVLTRSHGRTYARACDAFKYVQGFCMKIAGFSSQSHEETGQDEQNTSSLGAASTEILVKSDELDDVHSTPVCGEGGAEMEVETVPDAEQGQDQDPDLHTCGKCNGSLSFPFWYCIFCEDHLFICNACDAEGVPDLERSSGKHTEEHHLIRCLEPEKPVDKPLPTDQRLTSMESRLDAMQSQLDKLSACMGDLTGFMIDRNARVGTNEQLLKLAGSPEKAV